MELLDGLVNLLPAGVSVAVQNELSILLDAYKRSEVDVETGLGLLSLSSALTDLAEPSESLAANVAWQVGLSDVEHLMSTRQCAAFAHGRPVTAETDARGVRGAYLVHTTLRLAPGQTSRWHIVADVAHDAADVVALRDRLRRPDELPRSWRPTS